MTLSRPLLHAILAVSLILVLTSGIVWGDGRTEPPLTDEDVREQAKRLDIKTPMPRRLEAAKRLGHPSSAKHARLAVPALERCVREDPEANVREVAVQSLALIFRRRQEPCPLVVVEALLDPDMFVSQMANTYVRQFEIFAPGTVEVLLRCARSENATLRSHCLESLARAGGKDKKALEAIDKARHDKDFGVRHNAHAAMFQVTGNTVEFLSYIIRLHDNPESVLGPVSTDPEVEKQERTLRSFLWFSAALTFAEWSDKRPDDLARALLKLLSSPSPELRRGAARQIGTCVFKVDLAEEDQKKLSKVQMPQQKSNVVTHFEKLKVGDRLSELCASDPNHEVRATAFWALERFASAREKGPDR